MRERAWSQTYGRWLVAAALFASGCSGDLMTTRTVLTNVGVACIQGGEVRVDFGRCLSSSCDTLRDATCGVTLVGAVLEVTASAVVESDTGPGGCTTDCGFARTTCKLPEDTGGATSLRYAGNETALPATCTPF